MTLNELRGRVPSKGVSTVMLLIVAALAALGMHACNIRDREETYPPVEAAQPDGDFR